MFESSGEITETCPVPFSSIVTIPSSRMPDRNHFWTSRMMRLSPIRCSRKRTTHCWETSVKNGSSSLFHQQTETRKLRSRRFVGVEETSRASCEFEKPHPLIQPNAAQATHGGQFRKSRVSRKVSP